MRLIDADALCKVLEERITFRKGVVNNIENENQCDKEVLDIGKCMPTVEAEPIRHGHWKEVQNYDVYYECSACGEPWILLDGTPSDNNMNYCPNCGALMDKEEEDE